MVAYIRFLFLVSVLFLSSVMFGGKITISLTYIPMSVPWKEAIPDTPLADNYYSIPVVAPEQVVEPEGYYLVIEGADLGEAVNETVTLQGLTVSRRYVLTKVNGGLIFENKEKVPRRFSVIEEGDSVPKDFSVAAMSSARYLFVKAGTYTFVDADNPTSKVSVRALTACGLYPLRGSVLKIDIPSLNPGTYAIKVFYGFQQIFQEDFAMVGDAVQAVNYRIVNRTVVRDESTTFTGSRIVSSSPARTVREAAPSAGTTVPTPATSRNQP